MHAHALPVTGSTNWISPEVGAVLENLLTQANTHGGLGIGAMFASALCLTWIVKLVTVKLGDLTMFRSIAADVAAIVDKGDLRAAKTRIRDLEVAWDSAEAGLKARAAADWHTLDRVIKRALTALRVDSPTRTNCKAAMERLLKTFDSLQGNV
ncbi:hypothetical protein SAMN04244579_04488 [Azotobacter beijerinckii]|uniref:Uncharacterized protein n=1 Tax=Azotobacter beijerinckii TaxID=170623 RepID=A0A1H6ZC08_9GAMM|nr:hypothetical protein [Azotobacter beijerinckii]SEJ46415.1 hypothetical protein SAMN04244579_04488 [Azotobacter beijerinckii]